MINNQLKLAIPLSALLLLSSCRTEEFLQEIEQKEEISKKFITFTKKHENDVIDYGEGFKYLALRYDSIHKTNRTGKADIEAFRENLKSDRKNITFGRKEIVYINFNIRSQLIEEENGDKWMVFPEVKGKKVVNLVAAVLSKEETLLGYYKIKKEADFYKENIGLFQEKYNKRTFNSESFLTTMNDFGSWYNDGLHTSIDEIRLTGKRKSWEQLRVSDVILDDLAGGGGCGRFNACFHGIGMGGGNSGIMETPPPPNPCDKMSKIGKHEKTKELMNRLKDATKYNKEIGYVLESKGENIVPHYVEGEEGTAGIDFSVSGKVDGVIHSHYTKLLSIFSVSDIFGLAQMYKNGNIRDMNTFVMGLVTDSGTQYMMVIEDPTKFANFANNLFSENTIDKKSMEMYEYMYSNMYGIKPTNTSQENENSFVNYLQTTGSGLKLIKGDRNMDNWKVLERGNGSPIQQDCN